MRIHLTLVSFLLSVLKEFTTASEECLTASFYYNSQYTEYTYTTAYQYCDGACCGYVLDRECCTPVGGWFIGVVIGSVVGGSILITIVATTYKCWMPKLQKCMKCSTVTPTEETPTTTEETPTAIELSHLPFAQTSITSIPTCTPSSQTFTTTTPSRIPPARTKRRKKRTQRPKPPVQTPTTTLTELSHLPFAQTSTISTPSRTPSPQTSTTTKPSRIPPERTPTRKTTTPRPISPDQTPTAEATLRPTIPSAPPPPPLHWQPPRPPPPPAQYHEYDEIESDTEPEGEPPPSYSTLFPRQQHR